MSCGERTEPLGIEHTASGCMPGSQAAVDLRDPLCLSAETYESIAPAYSCMPEPRRHAVLARDIDRRLGAPVCQIKLASEIVQVGSNYQGVGDAMGMCEAFSEAEASLDGLQGAVGKAELPLRTRRIAPAHYCSALIVEAKRCRIVPGSDRIINRDRLVRRCRGIGKPAKKELRSRQSAPSQATTDVVLLLRNFDQRHGEIMGSLVLSTHNVAAP